MATTLYLVRHGHTKANHAFYICGRLEYPLDCIGINQAQHCHTTISRLNFDAVYCSPARRTRETAHIVTSSLIKPNDIQYDERLLESAFGNYEGSWGPFKSLHLWNYEQSYTKTHRGEETILGLEIRVREFLEEIRAKHPDQTVLAITHGGVITMIDAILEDRPRTGQFFRHFHVDNGSISVFYL